MLNEEMSLSPTAHVVEEWSGGGVEMEPEVGSGSGGVRSGDNARKVRATPAHHTGTAPPVSLCISDFRNVKKSLPPTPIEQPCIVEEEGTVDDRERRELELMGKSGG